MSSKQPQTDRHSVAVQLPWYLIVGGLSLCADYAVFLALSSEGLALAVVLGFICGTVVNYVLSRLLAFHGGRIGRIQELIRLFAVASLGLGMTLSLVLALNFLGLTPLWAKGVATIAVFAWNYAGRRIFVFGPEMPARTWNFTIRSMNALRGSDRTSSTGPLPDPPGRREQWIETLYARERFRDEYRARRDPVANERLQWRAQTFRHLVHLTPDQTILEFGSGDGSFSQILSQMTRKENRIVHATFAPREDSTSHSGGSEIIRVDDLPGPLTRESFDCVVGLDMLDDNYCARTLDVLQALLVPGGQLVLFETNPWNPLLRMRRALLGRREEDRRGLLSRPRLYELLSEVGFIRVFAVFSDFVYAPLNRFLVGLLRNVSIVAENTPFLRVFAGIIIVHAQKPPRLHFRTSRSLCDHPEFFKKVSVVVPCHNEEMNVQPLFQRLVQLYDEYLLEVIFVDDNSSDCTAEEISRLVSTDARVRAVIRQPPNGVGLAISDGIREAVGQWILTMDCDFQHLLPEIRDMFDRATEGADVVVGSRFSRNSILLNYPLMKIIANRGFHLMAALFTGRKFRDLTNNLKLMKADVAKTLILTSSGFAINAETGLLPVLMGARVVESPISWINRSFDMGASTFRLLRVGGGYAEVLWNVVLAQFFSAGPYACVASRKQASKERK